MSTAVVMDEPGLILVWFSQVARGQGGDPEVPGQAARGCLCKDTQQDSGSSHKFYSENWSLGSGAPRFLLLNDKGGRCFLEPQGG